MLAIHNPLNKIQEAITNDDLDKVIESFEYLNKSLNDDYYKEDHHIELLLFALENRNMNIIQYLINNIDVNAKSRTGNTVVGKYLILNKIFDMDLIFPILTKSDLNIQNSDGDTILHMAIREMDESYNQLTVWLVENGTDTLIKNDRGDSSLDLFISYDDGFMIELCLNQLKKRGINYITVDHLLIAVYKNNYDSVEAIFPFIKDINEIIPGYDCTILKYAQDDRFPPHIHDEIIELLVACGPARV